MSGIFTPMWKVEKVGQMRGHAGPVYALSRGQRPETLLTASGDRFIAQWNAVEWVADPFSIKLEQAAFSMCLLTSQPQLAVGQAVGGIHVIDLEAKQEWKHLVLHEKGVFCFLELPKEHMILSGGGDGSLALWSLPNWKLLRSFQLAQGKIRAIYPLSSDRVAVASSDGMVTILDLPLLNTLHQFHAHDDGTNCLQLLAHKPVLVSGGKDGHLRLWNMANDFQPLMAIPAHNYGIYDLKLSADGRTLASASRDSSIKLWDTATFDQPMKIARPAFDTHTHSVNALYWDHTSGVLYSTGDDRRIIGWRISRTD